jgi:hypothetical protein
VFSRVLQCPIIAEEVRILAGTNSTEGNCQDIQACRTAGEMVGMLTSLGRMQNIRDKQDLGFQTIISASSKDGEGAWAGNERKNCGKLRVENLPTINEEQRGE